MTLNLGYNTYFLISWDHIVVMEPLVTFFGDQLFTTFYYKNWTTFSLERSATFEMLCYTHHDPKQFF
ncbi:hypothetical protein BpHYR1_028481 [Brachionus plicatilis]|uniref:Uncharacterized protein n=1 Tax=Brachionus plicatilis TaxID=10195 RepID=A0A3M7S0Z3_BRAPC|nr:hypothetical protein BpHYR1_028481 [Brachionus plicatilis]